MNVNLRCSGKFLCEMAQAVLDELDKQGVLCHEDLDSDGFKDLMLAIHEVINENNILLKNNAK